MPAPRWRILLAIAVVTAIVGGLLWVSRSRTYVPAASGPAASTFEVPTYEWDGRSGMDAAVTGTLWFTPQGCTLLGDGEDDQQTAQATDSVWASPCSAADVDTLFYVHDAPYGVVVVVIAATTTR